MQNLDHEIFLKEKEKIQNLSLSFTGKLLFVLIIFLAFYDYTPNFIFWSDIPEPFLFLFRKELRKFKLHHISMPCSPSKFRTNISLNDNVKATIFIIITLK